MQTLINFSIRLLLCVMLLCPQTLCAQSVCKIQHFSIYNGLSQRTVTDITQDSKGFIWFSTWNGLNKFNGYTFKNYKSYPGDGCTLTSNRILKAVPNKSNDIWCQTYDNRVYLFDSHNEKFIDILQPIEEKLGKIYRVQRIYALPKGVSWIVCSNGSFRVDENKFKNNEDESIVYYHPKQNNLPGRTVNNVVQDADGDEWVFTNGGVCTIGQKSITDPTTFINLCHNNGEIYLVAPKRFATYHRASGQLKDISLPSATKRLNCIQSIATDTIALGTVSGFLLYYAQTKRFEHIDINTKAPSNTETIFKDRNNELWIFNHERGVTRYNITTREKQHYVTPPHNMPKAELKSRDLIFEDNQGTLWMVPHFGCLSYYDQKDKELKPYYTDITNPESKFTPVITNYYIDNQKNLWYTNNFWMDKVSFIPTTSQLEVFDKGYETRAFLVDKQQQLWVANKKGIVRIFNPDNTLRGYLTPEGRISKQEVAFGRNVYCFLEDERGQIWMGTKRSGIFRLKKQSNDSYHIDIYSNDENNPYSLNNNSVYCIYKDSKNRIWIATHSGGLNLMEETPQGPRFLHCDNLLTGYPQDRFNRARIIREVDNTILVGTTEGLITFDRDFKHVEDIVFHENVRQPNTASSLSSNDVLYIYTDSKQNTYVLTFTGGINQVLSDNLQTSNIEFKSYTKQNGLVSDLVLSMIEDHENNLWIISENAVAKFNPDNGSFVHYNEKDLQKEVYFSEASPVILQNHLILGTDAGVLSIAPDKLKKSTFAPPIVFTGLRIQGSGQDVNIDDLEELRLTPNERNVSFHFAALDYVDPVSINYSYRLKGLEEMWNEVDNSRTAGYINLPPGEYELQICSTNSNEVWSDNVRTLPVIVEPTFWETNQAYLIYVLLFLLVTGLIIYFIIYVYKLRQQIYIEQQLSNIKLRFFTDISHELRTPLTLIASPVGEVLEHERLSANARKLLTVVHANTERMLRLVNQILDFRKIENKKMKLLLEKTEIIGLLQTVMSNFNVMAEEKNIYFCMHADQKEIYCWIDRDKFEKIVFNLLSNAFKYTSANKSIIVSISTRNEELIVSVKDEGIGIDAQKQQALFQRFETLVNNNILQPSSGIGLSLVKELIELHQGSIKVNTEAGVGSEFIVMLPLNQKVYEKKENTEFILNDTPASPHQPSAQSMPDGNSGDDIAPLQSGIADPDTANAHEQDDNNAWVDMPSDENITVLVVEDNVELQDFLHDILSGTYNVIEATNGEEGLKQALLHVPDFIVSDVMMPVMDGLDMVKAIKENRDICHIPIIMLSAKSSLDDRILGLEQGIDDYITKPFSSTYLKMRIKSLLQQRKQLQTLYLEEWMQKQNSTKNEVGSSAPIVDVEPEKPQIVPFDEQFMNSVMDIMHRQMDNSDLTIDEFSQMLGMGRTVFYQKLKSIVGLSPVDFIREMRLKRAMQLIETGEYNISTIAYMTGFNDPKYFSKCFKKKYGVSPSDLTIKSK